MQLEKISSCIFFACLQKQKRLTSFVKLILRKFSHTKNIKNEKGGKFFMKKTITILTILCFVLAFVLTGNTYAAALDAINVEPSKTTIRPGEEVKVKIEFGVDLGAYTFDVHYDNAIFDYVSTEGGTPNDTSDKVRVVYHDTTGGSNPRTNMSVTFRAKDTITTSNPTEFTVTAEGLANPDASVQYDDITTPIVKNVTVEPEYIDYTLNLDYTGSIVKEEAKEIKLSYTSPMGRYYEHARLVAKASKPDGAEVRLIGTDQAGLEHDIIDSGWGDAQGYKIGGKDVSQVLNVRGLFSQAGNYDITLQLIDRDNSDQVIAQNTFNLAVLEEAAQEETPAPEEPTPEDVEKQEVPNSLPKTGNNIYIPLSLLLTIFIGASLFYNKTKQDN